MMSHDPRLPRAIPAEEDVSEWLDVFLRHGRCLLESGRGRKTSIRTLFSNYIMVADVYKTSSYNRVALSCGTLFVTSIGILDEDDEGGSKHYWRIKRYPFNKNQLGKRGYSIWWDFGGQRTSAAVLESHFEEELTVEGMLVDKRTNKRALWCAAQTYFEPYHQEGTVQGIKGRGDTVVISDGIRYGHGEHDESKTLVTNNSSTH